MTLKRCLQPYPYSLNSHRLSFCLFLSLSLCLCFRFRCIIVMVYLFVSLFFCFAIHFVIVRRNVEGGRVDRGRPIFSLSF